MREIFAMLNNSGFCQLRKKNFRRTQALRFRETGARTGGSSERRNSKSGALINVRLLK